MTVDYFQLGKLDYPEHENYPTQDVHTREAEKEYVAGWMTEAKRVALEKLDAEPEGYNPMEFY